MYIYIIFWRILCNLFSVSVKIQFSKESGHPVEECKLRVLYVPPPRPPSPVREGSEEGSSPRASISDNGNPNPSDFGVVSARWIGIYTLSFQSKRLFCDCITVLVGFKSYC